MAGRYKAAGIKYEAHNDFAPKTVSISGLIEDLKHSHRTRLEGYIQDPKFMGIPLVGLLLEGGIESIEDISRRIKQKIPIVLLEGTGRAADILAYAYNHYITTHKSLSLFRCLEATSFNPKPRLGSISTFYILARRGSLRRIT